jgi:hypothetical protein
MSKIEDVVIEKIKHRAAFGLVKYGISLADAGLSPKELLIHAQEEAMDLANYLEVLIQQEKVDCTKCDNRGKVRGLSEETYCQSCIYQHSWRVNHFKKKTAE